MQSDDAELPLSRYAGQEQEHGCGECNANYLLDFTNAPLFATPSEQKDMNSGQDETEDEAVANADENAAPSPGVQYQLSLAFWLNCAVRTLQ